MAARPYRRARWPIVLIGLFVVAVVGAATLVWGAPLVGMLQAPPQASSPTASARGTDAAAGQGEVADEPTDDAAWWRLRFDQAGMGVGQVIEVGTLGAGAIAQVEVPMQGVVPDALLFPIRSVIGPRAGLVVTIGADGPEAILSAVDATTGEVRQLVRTTDVIVDAQFVEGTSVLFLTGDAATGQMTGSWLIDAAAPAEPRPVEGLLGGAADVQLVARVTAQVRLFVSPTGDLAAVHRCGLEEVCTLRAVDLTDGTAHEHHMPIGDEPIGLGAGLVYVRPMCMQAFCPGEVLDLATGERRPMPDVGNRFSFDETVIETGSGPALLTQVGGVPGPADVPADELALVVTDLESGDAGPPIPVALESMRILGSSAHDLGVELPAGWVAVMGSLPGAGANVPTAVFAIEAATGRVVLLDALGDFFLQG